MEGISLFVKFISLSAMDEHWLRVRRFFTDGFMLLIIVFITCELFLVESGKFRLGPLCEL